MHQNLSKYVSDRVENGIFGISEKCFTSQAHFTSNIFPRSVIYCGCKHLVQYQLSQFNWSTEKNISLKMSADMCQYPNHLFLWFQILNKTRNINHLFFLLPMAFIFPFHAWFSCIFCQTKISRKMAKILEILWNPGSKIWVGFCWFQGVKIISSKKSPVKYGLWSTYVTSSKYDVCSLDLDRMMLNSALWFPVNCHRCSSSTVVKLLWIWLLVRLLYDH